MMTEQTIFQLLTYALAWVGSGLVVLTVMKTKIAEAERRLKELEESEKGYLTRTEFNERHRELLERVTRNETRIDLLWNGRK